MSDVNGNYSTSQYYSPTTKCNQCNKTRANDVPAVAQQHLDEKKRRRSSRVSKLGNLFRCLFLPCQCRGRHPNKIDSRKVEEYCTCNTPCMSSESVTVVDDLQQQQPWLVPSEYHKSMLSSSPSEIAHNQWIFRTGWTPQPHPLAFIYNNWCTKCGSCIKKDLDQCPSCQIEPFITTRHQHRLFGIEEN